MARPIKHNLDINLLKKLASIQCTMEEIAAICDCSVDTLERRYAEVIKKGKENGKTSLRRHLWKMVEAGNAGVAIWLSKQHLGMTEKNEVKEFSQQVVEVKELTSLQESQLTEEYKKSIE